MPRLRRWVRGLREHLGGAGCLRKAAAEPPHSKGSRDCMRGGVACRRSNRREIPRRANCALCPFLPLGKRDDNYQQKLFGLADGAKVDAELLAFFVEVAAFEAEGFGGVGHVVVILFQDCE
jgi:hypothetical protein